MEHPISAKTVWHPCRSAAKRAEFEKKIHPHGLRYSIAAICSKLEQTCGLIQPGSAHNVPGHRCDACGDTAA
jgi:site-specific recombinase XerC